MYIHVVTCAQKYTISVIPRRYYILRGQLNRKQAFVMKQMSSENSASNHFVINIPHVYVALGQLQLTLVSQLPQSPIRSMCIDKTSTSSPSQRLREDLDIPFIGQYTGRHRYMYLIYPSQFLFLSFSLHLDFFLLLSSTHYPYSPIYRETNELIVDRAKFTINDTLMIKFSTHFTRICRIGLTFLGLCTQQISVDHTKTAGGNRGSIYLKIYRPAYEIYCKTKRYL